MLFLLHVSGIQALLRHMGVSEDWDTPSHDG
jgi:hypothetical protein